MNAKDGAEQTHRMFESGVPGFSYRPTLYTSYAFLALSAVCIYGSVLEFEYLFWSCSSLNDLASAIQVSKELYSWKRSKVKEIRTEGRFHGNVGFYNKARLPLSNQVFEAASL